MRNGFVLGSSFSFQSASVADHLARFGEELRRAINFCEIDGSLLFRSGNSLLG